MILSFKQGVNELLQIEMPFNPILLEKYTVDLVQQGRIVVSKNQDACTLDGNNITVNLTQSDTLLLSPQRVALTFRGKYPDGGTVIMEDVSCVIHRSEYKEVI